METWIAAVARVEWRSEARGAERPSAVVMGDERREVRVETAWVEGSPRAGEPSRRRFVAVDALGRRYRLTLDLDGAERVEVAASRAERG